MWTRRWPWPCLLAVLLLALSSCQTAGTRAQVPPATARAAPVDPVIVIFLENRSFDHLYGQFPGARGLQEPEARILQTDRDGRPYGILPPVTVGHGKTEIDPRFPAALLNAPFVIDPFAPADEKTPNPVHRFYQHILQIDRGKMDRYVAWSGTGGLAMGHYPANNLLNSLDFTREP
jgi:phospholipase C